MSSQAAQPSGATRPSRRSAGEVRELLLDAAQSLFSSRGYAGTSTKRIADRAGVAEALLFRHFESKANLFNEAVYEPFAAALREYLQEWVDTERPHTPEQPVHEFIERIFTALTDRRGAALAMLGTSTYSQEVAGSLAGEELPLAGLLGQLEKVVVNESQRFGYEGIDAPVAARVGLGMVLAVTVFRDWLFSSNPSVTDEELIAEMSTIMLHGIAHRPS